MNEYELICNFNCHGVNMVVIRLENGTHVMSEYEWKYIKKMCEVTKRKRIKNKRIA